MLKDQKFEHCKCKLLCTGSEWPYVIVSTVRSCSISDIESYTPSKTWLGKRLGFITDPNQVNVAITRAQDGLCILGKQWMMLINWWQICKPRSIVLSFEKNLFLWIFCFKYLPVLFSFKTLYFVFQYFYTWLKCLNVFVACVQVVTVFSISFMFTHTHKHVCQHICSYIAYYSCNIPIFIIS